MYSIAQQAVVLFFLVLGVQAVRASIHTLVHGTPLSPAIVVPAIVSTLLWPFVSGILRSLTLQFRVQ